LIRSFLSDIPLLSPSNLIGRDPTNVRSREEVRVSVVAVQSRGEVGEEEEEGEKTRPEVFFNGVTGVLSKNFHFGPLIFMSPARGASSDISLFAFWHSLSVRQGEETEPRRGKGRRGGLFCLTLSATSIQLRLIPARAVNAPVSPTAKTGDAAARKAAFARRSNFIPQREVTRRRRGATNNASPFRSGWRLRAGEKGAPFSIGARGATSPFFR